LDATSHVIQLTPVNEGGLEGPLCLDPRDHSGTPMALIELARRGRRLVLLNHVDPEEILIEFPMGPIPKEQTKASRFVRLRIGDYALIR
jgi:hypothetical protein